MGAISVPVAHYVKSLLSWPQFASEMQFYEAFCAISNAGFSEVVN